MPAKQGFGGNKINAKRLCLLSSLCVLSLGLSYLETLLPTAFIAPGIKLGIANAAAVVLIYKKDFNGAVMISAVRIILSSLLFSGAFSAVFSLAGAAVSLSLCYILAKSGKFSIVAVSAAGGAVHNLAQAAVALFTVGKAVIYYLPALIIAGAVSGAVIGALCYLILKKIKTNR